MALQRASMCCADFCRSQHMPCLPWQRPRSCTPHAVRSNSTGENNMTTCIWQTSADAAVQDSDRLLINIRVRRMATCLKHTPHQTHIHSLIHRDNLPHEAVQPSAWEHTPGHAGASGPLHRHVTIKVHIRNADDHLAWALGSHDVHMVLHKPQLRPPAVLRAAGTALRRLR